MKSGEVTFPGGSSYVDLITETNPSEQVIVTALENMNAWVEWVGFWRIYVSDSSYTGKVGYTII